MTMLFSLKEKVKTTQKANLSYDAEWSACKLHYTGKTGRCLLPVFINMGVDMINQCSKT